MSSYSTSDYKNIATTVNMNLDDITNHKGAFEAVALWHSLDCRRPRRTPPAKLRNKMDQIAQSANRLLKHLGIENHEDAYDGPGDAEILATLAWSPNLDEDWDEDAVTIATRRIGRLAEIIESVKAAYELENEAHKAAEEALKFGALTVVPGNHGNDAVNSWIACMMGIYKDITGNEPATSVGAQGRLDEGVGGGPLIRFLKAAGEPLKIEYDGDAWRKRIRTIKQQTCQ